MNEINIEVECGSCKGTGIFVGMAERDGYGVVCHTCKGTGARQLTYNRFTGRKLHKEVLWVIEHNPGIAVGRGGKKDRRTGEVGPTFPVDDFGGIRYFDWTLLQDPLEFPPGKEMRNYTCPYWWYHQFDKFDDPLEYCEERRDTDWGMTYRSCKQFVLKDQCWEAFDEQFGEAE